MTSTPMMSLWRVELLRLVRTRRLLVLVCLYLFLGASGPLLARYAQQVFSGLSGSGSVKITFTKPVPADGLLGFYKSATQLGLVACVVIAALAFCLDARPALAVYYRTRSSTTRVLLPRLVATGAAVSLAYTVGLLFAWYETTVLIGAPDVGDTLATWGLGLAYTLFAVTLTFAAAGILRSALAVVGGTVGVLIVLPIAGNAPALSRWLPSRLAGLPTDLFHHAPSTSAVTTLAMSVALAAAAVLLGLWRVAGRQVTR